MPPILANLPLVKTRAKREIGRRIFPEAPWERTHVRPMRETARLVAGRMRWAGPTRHETGWASVDEVYRELDRDVASYLGRAAARGVRAVYAYEDGALETFRVARSRGLKRLYDLPIAHWRTLRRLLAEEADMHPAWAPTMEGLVDSPSKLERKDEEIELADQVVVASSFTRRSLEEHFGRDLAITLTPYGAPPPLVTYPARRRAGEPLHLFYAGHLTQRKGMAYLIAALHSVDIPWQMTLAGPRPAAAPPELDAFLADPRCRWLGHVPHATLLEEMTRAHVFVFPSIAEGFAMVLFEAMAAGMPVITTPHTAGPDIMTSGQEGFIVPIRDPNAIAACIALLHADEDRRLAMAMTALAQATTSRWQDYEAKIIAIFDEILA